MVINNRKNVALYQKVCYC